MSGQLATAWNWVFFGVGLSMGVVGLLTVQSVHQYRRHQRYMRSTSYPVPVMRLRVNETTARMDRDRAAEHQRNRHPKRSTQPTPMSDQAQASFERSFDFDGD